MVLVNHLPALPAGKSRIRTVKRDNHRPIPEAELAPPE
jgi:hypothetical protein